MVSSGITGRTFTLETLFLGKTTYAIEYYQREYEWGPDEVQTLLHDLVEEFKRADGARKARWWSQQLTQHFLGPFVYTDEPGDKRFLADGKQRFTTLHLIFLHLLRALPDSASKKIERRLTGAVVAGYHRDRPRFRLELDERQQAMEALLDDHHYEVPLGASLSLQNLWARSQQIAGDLSQQFDSDQLDPFVD
ncbi:DUF262 domain-containing protein [Pseudonocardia nematodicida]|uniref:DUF262 domain-containing protein n=1 Tax=Pseudonocardia nematodicida TaxID=1206997 RepID=A0ABV1KJW8_9PSEU